MSAQGRAKSRSDAAPPGSREVSSHDQSSERAKQKGNPPQKRKTKLDSCRALSELPGCCWNHFPRATLTSFALPWAVMSLPFQGESQNAKEHMARCRKITK